MKKTKPLCNELSLSKACSFLKRKKSFCILCHTSPDGDTLGAAFALAMGLKAVGKKCFIMCADEIPKKFNYFAEQGYLEPVDFDTVVAVDVADDKLLGSLQEVFKDRVDLCIDHHISNTRYAKNLYLDESASATCECIFEIIEKMHLPMNDKIAAALFTGIATDTGSFKYSNVTAKTHLIAAKLYAYNIDAASIGKKMFDTKSKNRLELERLVLKDAQFHFNERCILLTATTAMLKKTGCTDNDLEGIAVLSSCVEGVIAGVSVKQKDENEYRISLRTYEPLDAAEICKSLGGGGHRAAAGCTLYGTLGEVQAKVLNAIGQALEECDAGTASC